MQAIQLCRTLDSNQRDWWTRFGPLRWNIPSISTNNVLVILLPFFQLVPGNKTGWGGSYALVRVHQRWSRFGAIRAISVSNWIWVCVRHVLVGIWYLEEGILLSKRRSVVLRGVVEACELDQSIYWCHQTRSTRNHLILRKVYSVGCRTRTPSPQCTVASSPRCLLRHSHVTSWPYALGALFEASIWRILHYFSIAMTQCRTIH